MSIPPIPVRNAFIDSLRFCYAQDLPAKSICNPADISFAATHLYAYGTPFQSPLSGNQPHYGSADIPLLGTLLAPFFQKVWDYFNTMPTITSQASFDQFHKKLCDLFLQCIASGGVYTHTYGNAQKMVNMLFKYLACFDDAPSFAHKFTYCHVALDGYTYYASSYSYPLSFYRDVVYPSIHHTATPLLSSWSTIATHSAYQSIEDDICSYFTANPKTHNDYWNICKLFPIFTSVPKLPKRSNYTLTPFEAEFFIWAIAQECSRRAPTKDFIYRDTIIDYIRSLL